MVIDISVLDKNFLAVHKGKLDNFFPLNKLVQGSEYQQYLCTVKVLAFYFLVYFWNLSEVIFRLALVRCANDFLVSKPKLAM